MGYSPAGTGAGPVEAATRRRASGRSVAKSLAQVPPVPAKREVEAGVLKRRKRFVSTSRLQAITNEITAQYAGTSQPLFVSSSPAT